MHLLDPITASPWLRSRHPYEKVAFCGGLLLLCLLLPPPGAILVLTTVSLAALTLARITPLAWLKILLLPASFIVAGIIPLLFSLSYGRSAGLALAWEPTQIMPATRIALRAFASAATLGLLALTTPPSEWVPLLHRANVPTFIADMMLVIYRLIFIITARFASMQTAQQARLGYAGMTNTFRSSGLVGANLLLFALKRSQAMELGLAARGFTEALPNLPPEQTLSRPTLVGILLLLVSLATTTLLIRGVLI